MEGSVSMGGLLPPAAVVVEAFSDDPGDLPFAGEEHLITDAVNGRRREFVTARRCARQALTALGLPATAIPAGPDRQPQWPSGVAGSITHCPGYRAAAVAMGTEVASLGIDAEPHEPLPGGAVVRTGAGAQSRPGVQMSWCSARLCPVRSIASGIDRNGCPRRVSAAVRSKRCFWPISHRLSRSWGSAPASDLDSEQFTDHLNPSRSKNLKIKVSTISGDCQNSTSLAIVRLTGRS